MNALLIKRNYPLDTVTDELVELNQPRVLTSETIQSCVGLLAMIAQAKVGDVHKPPEPEVG